MTARSCSRALAIALLSLALSARAQQPPEATLRDVIEPGAANGATSAPAPDLADALGRTTPRGAVAGFLRATRAGDWGTAKDYLDLGNLAPEARAARGEELARALAAALADNPPLSLDGLSDDPAGSEEAALSPLREYVASLRTPGEASAVPLVLRQQRTAAGSIWLVERAALAEIARRYEGFGVRRSAEQHLPEAMLWNAAGLAIWQWAALCVLVAGTTAVSAATASLLTRVLRWLARLTPWRLDDALAERLRGPLGLVLAVGLFSLGRRFLEIAYVPSLVLSTLEVAVLVAAAAWAAMRAIDLVADLHRVGAFSAGGHPVAPLISIGSRLAKACVVAIAIATALGNAGFDVTALLAGLGIGGIAVALAAQRSLENLFGGITLLVDRPVRIGELCRIGDRIGRIEEIGPRSTRFRTLDWTVVSIPNGQLATLQIESLGSRHRMWFHPTLALRYDTPGDDLPGLFEALRERIASHPKVHAETVRAQLVGFGASSLQVELSAYVRTASLEEYADVTQALLLAALALLSERGSGLAFSGPPTFR